MLFLLTLLSSSAYMQAETLSMKKHGIIFLRVIRIILKTEVLKARDEIENNIWQNNREIPAN